MFIFKAVMETKADERMRDKWTGNEVWANEKYTNLGGNWGQLLLLPWKYRDYAGYAGYIYVCVFLFCPV